MKRIFLLAAALFVLMLLGSFFNFDLEATKADLQFEVESLQKEIDAYYLEINTLQAEIDALQKVKDDLVSKDSIVYIVDLEISQTHFSGEVSTHLKDSMNKTSISIQVSEQYYYSVKVGDILNNELRIGSLLLKSSVGNWNIKVIDKQAVTITE